MQVRYARSSQLLYLLSRFLLGIVIIAWAILPLSAQSKTLPLEKEAEIEMSYEEETEGIYFKDIHHLLNKFEGTWKGTGVGGHEVTLQLKIFQKVYDDMGECYADVLGFKLEIRKDGAKLPPPLRPWQLIPGTEWYRGDGFDTDDDDKTLPDTYQFYLNFNDQRKHGYWGATFVTGQLSKDGKTLTISHGGTVVVENEIPSFPPYIPKASFRVAWVLHRVGK